jgi:hypothetical protein
MTTGFWVALGLWWRFALGDHVWRGFVVVAWAREHDEILRCAQNYGGGGARRLSGNCVNQELGRTSVI